MDLSVGKCVIWYELYTSPFQYYFMFVLCSVCGENVIFTALLCVYSLRFFLMHLFHFILCKSCDIMTLMTASTYAASYLFNNNVCLMHV